jgi:hypothetical protein
MKPKEYIKKYNLFEQSHFDRDGFVQDFKADIESYIQNQGGMKITPAKWENLVTDFNNKLKNIFNGSKVPVEATDKFWGFIFATVIIPKREAIFGKNYKQAKLDYKYKTDPDFRRRFDCWQMHKDNEQWEREFFSQSYKRAYEEMFENFRKAISRQFIDISLILQARNTLGIPEDEDLSVDLINFAYRERAMLYHPDRGGDSEKFIEVGKAKEILMQEIKRTA